ncbi:MAG: hypothetical protein EAZ35_10190 [Sphingobacteriia bacterium]|nr:MAG: hypothetical protein EAZ35_10190 [Sphingobacteriia bacterium]
MQLERLPVDKITAKYEAMEASITKGLLKQLGKLEKRETSLKKAVFLKDSLKASVLFSGTTAKLAQLTAQVKKPSAYLNKKLGGNYIPMVKWAILKMAAMAVPMIICMITTAI